MSYLTYISTITPLALFYLVSSITPGPNNIMILTATARAGFIKSMPHLLGISIGHTLQVFLIIITFEVVFNLFQQLKIIFVIIATAYLLWMAYGLMMEAITAHHEVKLKKIKMKLPLTFIGAVSFQWINPKAWVMGITAASVFVPSDIPRVLAIILTLTTIMAVNLPAVSLWALAGSKLRKYLHIVWVARVFYFTMAIAMIYSTYFTAKTVF